MKGVLLVNVGTPDDPSVPSVRRYLREFLSDPGVINLPAPLRWLLLNAVILPFRPARSAHAYRQIWTEHGSPLMLHTNAQAVALQRELPGYVVRVGMRYGNPSLRAALESLNNAGVTQVLLVPMFPQYAGATVGSVVSAWNSLGHKRSTVFEPFHALSGFVQASGELLKQTCEPLENPHVLFSFHGLPVSHDSTTQYVEQCRTTAQAIAAAASVNDYSFSFQSRLKGQKWTQPFTDEVLTGLATKGVKRVAVACPSFVADCLETLEEIGLRARDTFRAAGGEELVLVPAVNEHPVFISALAAAITEVHHAAR